jgi:hypothetical protein
VNSPTPEEILGMAVGLETSRRIAWARYYKAMEDNKKLHDINFRLQQEIAELCLLITESEAIQILESESLLVMRARSILGSLRRRAKGASAIRIVMERYGKETA